MNKKICLLIALLYFPFLQQSIYSQDYTQDSLAVKAILDSNGLHTVVVESVTVVASGRIMLLKLNGKKISTIPPAIKKLTDLKFLELRGNKLTSFPPEICDLPSLIELELRSNELTTIPAEIANLINLTKLLLSLPDLLSGIMPV